MSSEPFLLRGVEGKVYLNNTLHDVKEYTVRITRTKINSRTTGDGRFQTSAVDSEVLEFSFKGLSLSNLNPHVSPLYIMATPTNPTSSISSNADTSAVKFFKNATEVADDTKAYRATILWDSFNQTGNAESGAQMYDAKGESQGSFKRPGDA